MKTTSKVKSVQQSGTWSAQDGTLYYKHEYLFEDGIVMNALHKTQRPYNDGDEIEYEVTKDDPTYGKSGRVNKPNDFQKGGFKKQQSSTASFALAYAKDWCIAKDSIGTPQTADHVIMVANVFNKWLKENG